MNAAARHTTSESEHASCRSGFDGLLGLGTPGPACVASEPAICRMATARAQAALPFVARETAARHRAALTSRDVVIRQGTIAIGACQNATFCPVGSSTVTWQS